MKKGMDISYYQKDIDFSLVKMSGIEFVIIREGYRNSTDSRFFEYVSQAKESGIKILGVYHFSYAIDKQSAVEEARLCVKNMIAAGLDTDTIVFYDFEYDTVKKAALKGFSLDKNDCNRHTVAFCEEVKKLGFTPGIYTNIDFYKNWYRKDVLEKYHIWLADYKGDADFDCLIQQYTSKGSVPGIVGNVDLNYYYGEDFKMEEKNEKSRFKVVDLARSWIGKKESDGSFKSIIDTYNSYTPHPRGVRMTYTASWCATFWSALAISLGYTDIMPIECSCGELIKKAKEMGIWVEDDSYVAFPGDAILYDWNDTGVGDNVGWPDHIGVIEEINDGVYTVIEGNKNNAVERRVVKVNGKFIRGFITPKYDDETLGEPSEWTVTTHALNIREKPTKDSKSLGYVSMGDKVFGTGSVKTVNGKNWIEVVIPGSTKVGWCSEGSGESIYLKRK